MRCHIHVRVELGTQIFGQELRNYVNVAYPDSANRHLR